MRTGRTLPALAAVMILAACASTGATFRSGVGDALLEHPPYYAGLKMEDVARDTGGIAHVAIAFQRGAAQPEIFDPASGAGTPLRALLDDMNRYLASLGISRAVADGVLSDRGKAVPPDVRFGCIPENGMPGNDCAERGDSALGRGRQAMQLSVGRPSSEWVTWAGRGGKAVGAGRVLVITLEVGNYLIRQEGLAGTKVLELGTGNRARLPWLTSLETPVAVLQLTAALVDSSGKALRIGAEGFQARRTRLGISALGAQEMLGDEDVEAARTARREDLPGAPLAWQVALRELVARVTGREVGSQLTRG